MREKGARRDDDRAEDTVRAGPFIYPYILVMTPFSSVRFFLNTPFYSDRYSPNTG